MKKILLALALIISACMPAISLAQSRIDYSELRRQKEEEEDRLREAKYAAEDSAYAAENDYVEEVAEMQLIFQKNYEEDLIAYVGIENPIKVKINQAKVTNPANLAIISTNKQKTCTITHDPDGGILDFIMTPTTESVQKLKVVEWFGNNQVTIATFKVRVYDPPTPSIFFGTYKDTETIYRDDFAPYEEFRLQAIIEDPEVDFPKPKIISFKMSAGNSVYVSAQGSYLTHAMVDLINQAPTGSRLKFKDIIVELADGETLKLRAEYRLN